MFEDKDNFLFDLYGTLVDIWTDETRPELWRVMASFYSMKGASYSSGEFSSVYRRICEERSAPEKEIDLYEVFRDLFTLREILPSRTEVSDAAMVFRSASIVEIGLFDGAEEVLRELRRRGKKVYLFSNAQECFTVPELKRLGIYGLFDGIRISSKIGYCKPSLSFYRKALGRLDPNASVMIGNDEFADVRGAVNAGIDACYIQSRQSLTCPGEAALPCPKIENLRELLD